MTSYFIIGFFILISLFTINHSQNTSITDSKTIKEARANTKLARTNRRGCTCESGKCDCCVNLFISSLDVEDLGCAKFAYVPEDKGVRVDLTLNDRVVYQNEISAPRQDGGSSSTPTLPPMCAPLPRFPYIEICARFSSPSFATNGGIRFCMSMEARVQGKTVYRMDFDCMTYSGNGIVTQFPQLAQMAQMAQAARPPSPPRSEKERKSKN